MSNDYLNEFWDAASRQGAIVERYEDVEHIRSEINSKFTDPGAKSSIWIWERLKSHFGIHGSQYLDLLPSLPLPKQVIVLFNRYEDKSAVLLEDSSKLLPIINDTYGFEFYVTDKPVSFLLCYNHHEILSACGDAEQWLKEVARGQGREEKN
jgi:hypothetical protein